MKKSLKKQAVFPVLMLLVVTALALIGSSFAWFAMTNVASVSTFNSTVEKGSTGLMISANGQDYVGTVTLGDETLADKKTQLSTSWINPDALHQVSTQTGYSFFEATIKSKNDAGKVATITSNADASHPTANLTAATSTVAKDANSQDLPAHMIVFDLYFQIEVNNAHLYLNAGSSVATTDDKSAQNAIRVAFLNLGHSTTTSGVISASSNTPTTKIWKPIDDTKTTYGLKAASNTTEFNAYASHDTYAASNNELVNIVPQTDYATQVNPAPAANTQIADLVNGYNKVRVLVWLEGQDEDCVVEIAQGAIAVTLNFFALEYTA